MAQVVADIVAGLGTMTGFIGKIVSLTDKLTLGRVFQNIGEANKGKTPFDPMSMKVQDLTPAGIKIIMARQKADKEAAKRQKELAALASKQTKAIKEQTALAKAKAVLDKSNAVFNMDLIQNTAALQGKVTENETLRLKLQREILLGNSKAAADLAQELLSIQLAAVIAGNVDPFGNLKDSVLSAISSIKQLRDELQQLGAPKVKTPAQMLAEDYQAVLIDLTDTSFDLQTQAVDDFLNSINTPSPSNLPSGQVYLPPSFAGFGPTNAQISNVVISIDPTAAQYGISAAVVNNASNGNSNDFRRTGTGF
jgi:hypothetical protein